MLTIRSALIVLTAAGLLVAGDWVTSGGDPSRSGLSDEVGPGSADVLWQGTLSGWFGTPCFISGVKLVTMRFQSIDVAYVTCHDLQTGAVLWSVDFPGTNSRSVPVGFRDGQVYAVNFRESHHDTLYALNPTTGAVLWRAGTQVEMSITESVSFADNGDLLVSADDFQIARIDRTNGSVVWVCPRVWPVTGSADICVCGSRAYAYQGDIGSLRLMSIDLATGQMVDTVRIEDTHPGGPMPQAAPMVGPDGTIYAHKVGDNVTAIKDFGDSLHILWVREISASPYCVFAHFAVGPDSTVYVGSNGRIMRLSPPDGSVLDSSEVISEGNLFQCRLAIDSVGKVYATNGGGKLYCFGPALDTRWSFDIPNVNTSGPALGPGGLLAVAGAGTTLYVFEPLTGLQEQESARTLVPSASPNPFRGLVRLNLPPDQTGDVLVYDRSGRLVRRLPVQDGRTTWDGSDDSGAELASGIYYARTGSGGNACALVLGH